MMGSRTFKLRVTYEKSGRLSMLSHLELTHAIERLVRRSKLPFALTEGFSPHMKLAYGSALPVGIGSNCEVFDVVLDDYVSPKRALEALRSSCPDDMMCIDCGYIEPSATAASVAFPYSVYEVELDRPVDSMRVPTEVTIHRKKGDKVISVSDHMMGEPFVNGSSVRFQTRSGQDGSLRPDVLLSASAFDPSAEVVSVRRIAQSSDPIESIELL